jgi:hypothetical protein
MLFNRGLAFLSRASSGVSTYGCEELAMIDISLAIKSAEELDKTVGIVAKLVNNLKTNPDLAAQKLGQALSEVAKTLQVVDNAASQFLSLGIDQGALAKNSVLLLAIDGGSLRTEVERGRGHCHVIDEIYETYLDKWFARALDGYEYNSVKNAFKKLNSGDRDLFYALVTVAEVLEAEAGVVLDFVVKGEESIARTRVLSALPALRPLRKTISKTMQMLYSMQSEFVDITGAV